MSSEARHWRLRKQRYCLIGEKCGNCETKIFPPRDICTDCGKKANEPYEFSGKGEIYSFTTVYEAPAGFEDQTPYTVALIKLEEGPLVTAQLTDMGNEEVSIGMPVEMATRRLRSVGEEEALIYGYKFRPRLADLLAPEPGR